MTSAATEENSKKQKQLAGFWLRAFGAIIDVTVALFVIGPMVAYFSGEEYFHTSNGFGIHLDGLPAFLVIVLVFLYFWIMEAYCSATLGKLLLGLRVRKIDGSPCDIKASLIRNRVRLFDSGCFYLVGAIFFWCTQKNQRLGDLAALTVVIRRKGAQKQTAQTAQEQLDNTPERQQQSVESPAGESAQIQPEDSSPPTSGMAIASMIFSIIGFLLLFRILDASTQHIIITHTNNSLLMCGS